MKKGLLLIAAIIFIAFNSNAQNFSEDFSDTNMDGWLTVAPTYATNPYTWGLSEYSGVYYLSAAAYDGTNHATEQWVISPKLDATGISSLDITFDNRARYTPYQNLEVYVSTDFAGDSASFSAATWTQVTGFTWDASYDDYDWEIATTSTATITGTATTYIAFKYVSIDGGDGSGGNWTIDNISVSAPIAASVENISISTKLFPNPASSILNIKSEANISNITVANVIGQRVLSINNINADNYKLNVEDLNNGVYMININNVDGTSTVAKFVKK